MNSSTNSTVLNLETLSKQYDTILTEYTQTQTDYINYISSLPCKNSSCATLSNMSGYTYYGTNTLQNSSQSSPDNCVALCSSIDGCSGGTFNSNSSNCQLVSGNGTLNTASDTDYAIVSQDKIYLQKLQSLNSMLTEVNTQILNAISSGQDEYQKQDETRSIQTTSLQQNHHTLITEQEKLAQLLRENNEATNEQNYTAMRSKSYYYSFLLFLFFMINCAFILISLTVGKETMVGDTFRRNLFLLIIFEFLFFFMFLQSSY
jgi:hypothetical protein